MGNDFKMKSCIECGETLLVDAEVPEERTFDGVVYTELLPVQECTRCKENYALGLAVIKMEDRLVERLGKLTDLGPEAAKFVKKIRKAREHKRRLERLAAVIQCL